MAKKINNDPQVDGDEPEAVPKETQAKPGKSWLKMALRFISSLRLTVVLLGMAVFIVFAGTVAQVDEGLWTVVDKYFRTTLPVDISIPVVAPHGMEIPWFCWIDFKIFFPRAWNVRNLFSGWLVDRLGVAGEPDSGAHGAIQGLCKWAEIGFWHSGNGDRVCINLDGHSGRVFEELGNHR